MDLLHQRSPSGLTAARRRRAVVVLLLGMWGITAGLCGASWSLLAYNVRRKGSGVEGKILERWDTPLQPSVA
jgi:hypothetical protein